MLTVMFICRCRCRYSEFATIMIRTETSLWSRRSLFARNSKKPQTSLVSSNYVAKLSEGTSSVTHGLFALHENGTGTWAKWKVQYRVEMSTLV